MTAVDIATARSVVFYLKKTAPGFTSAKFNSGSYMPPYSACPSIE